MKIILFKCIDEDYASDSRNCLIFNQVYVGWYDNFDDHHQGVTFISNTGLQIWCFKRRFLALTD